MLNFFPQDLKPLTAEEEHLFRTFGKYFKYETTEGIIIFYYYLGKILIDSFENKGASNENQE